MKFRDLFRLIGHRGAAALAPENTMPSFVKAYECGATAIEFDVRLTKDGVPVILHDEDLKRVAGVEARVADLSLEELRKFKVFGEAPVPTLEEVLSFASGKLAVDVELKVEGAERKVVSLLEKYGLKERALITSFLPQALSRIKSVEPGLRVGLLVDEWSDDHFETAREVGACALLPRYTNVTPDVVEKVKEEGYALIVWTVNEPSEAARLLEMGVDGIITDDPCKLRGVVMRECK